LAAGQSAEGKDDDGEAAMRSRTAQLRLFGETVELWRRSMFGGFRVRQGLFFACPQKKQDGSVFPDIDHCSWRLEKVILCISLKKVTYFSPENRDFPPGMLFRLHCS